MVEGHTLETFEEIRKLFMAKYFPPDKMNKLRLELFQFQQFDGESYTEVWERFQELLRQCPSSLLRQGNPIYNFFNGLVEETHAMLNANAGGQLMKKTSLEVHELRKRVAKQSRYYTSKERRMPRKQGGLLETDEATILQAQIATLTRS